MWSAWWWQQLSKHFFRSCFKPWTVLFCGLPKLWKARKSRTCNSSALCPGRPPHKLSSVQFWIQGFKLATAAEANKRQQMAAMLSGRLPSPLGLSIKTVRACAHVSGILPSCKHFFQRRERGSNAAGASLAKSDPRHPSGPAAFPLAACAIFHKVQAVGARKSISCAFGKKSAKSSWLLRGFCNQSLFHIFCKCTTCRAGSIGNSSCMLLLGSVQVGRFNQAKVRESDNAISRRREALSAACLSCAYCCAMLSRADSFQVTAGSVSSGHLWVTHVRSCEIFLYSWGHGFTFHSLRRRMYLCNRRSAVSSGNLLLLEKGLTKRGGRTMPRDTMSTGSHQRCIPRVWSLRWPCPLCKSQSQRNRRFQWSHCHSVRHKPEPSQCSTSPRFHSTHSPSSSSKRWRRSWHGSIPSPTWRSPHAWTSPKLHKGQAKRNPELHPVPNQPPATWWSCRQCFPGGWAGNLSISISLRSIHRIAQFESQSILFQRGFKPHNLVKP